ncbi:MAG: hypothetical protein NVS3B16_25680 [Vulcanimicrobiaceae bacterium]
MSDSGESELPDTFVRSREEFGEDAVKALRGVLDVFESLSAGFEVLNDHPPLNQFFAAQKAVRELVSFTERRYIRK